MFLGFDDDEHSAEGSTEKELVGALHPEAAIHGWLMRGVHKLTTPFAVHCCQWQEEVTLGSLFWQSINKPSKSVGHQ